MSRSGGCRGPRGALRKLHDAATPGTTFPRSIAEEASDAILDIAWWRLQLLPQPGDARERPQMDRCLRASYEPVAQPRTVRPHEGFAKPGITRNELAWQIGDRGVGRRRL